VGLFNQYAEELREEFQKMRYLIVGGDALDAGVMRRMVEGGKGPEHLVNGYGPTETTTFAVTHEIEEVGEKERSIPIGRPIGNTRIYIVDGEMEPV
jgi:non-ribosomal peptide synthetase component F